MSWLLEAGPFGAAFRDARPLFNAVRVRLRERQLTVLEGSSGSGKTTLLRQLAGLAPCAAASRALQGAAYRRRQLSAWRARVTLLAQDAPMLPGSVAANLSFPFSQAVGVDRACDQRRQGELLSALGLGELTPERDVGLLSGGERHRLALVRGLLWDPPVLLADEPFGGLDQEAAAACFALLCGFARRAGHAALVVLHDRRLAAQADANLRLDGPRLEER